MSSTSATDRFKSLAPITIAVMLSGAVLIVVGLERSSMDLMIAGASISVVGFLGTMFLMVLDERTNQNGGVA